MNGMFNTLDNITASEAVLEMVNVSIVADHWSNELSDVGGKVCTLDLFRRD